AFDGSIGERAINPARRALNRWLAVGAQGLPESERALRIGIHQQAAAAGGMGTGGKVGGERALAGTTLARSERDELHRAPPGWRAPATGLVNGGLNGKGLPSTPPRHFLHRNTTRVRNFGPEPALLRRD